jgi:hypothetical protein
MATTGAPFPDVRKALREGWQAPLPDGVLRSRMDDGSSKKRVISTAIGGVEPFTLKLSPADLALVRTHWDENKALRFDFAHPVWGEVEAEYDAPPAISQDGVKYVVQLRLEIFVV